MIPELIIESLVNIDAEVDRDKDEIEDVSRNINLLGLSHDGQISQFFNRYKLSGIISTKNFELLDLCRPDDEIYETTDWAKDVYELPDDFVCLTSGEGEGFVLFSKTDGKVYDVSVSQFDDLSQGKVEPRWDSFFDLIGWYLKE
jgi:hypothetical protein